MQSFVGRKFLIFLLPKFLFKFTFHKFFDFYLPDINESLAQNFIKITQFSITLSLFKQFQQVSGLYLL